MISVITLGKLQLILFGINKTCMLLGLIINSRKNDWTNKSSLSLTICDSLQSDKHVLSFSSG